MQAVSFRHKQPALSSVQKLLSWISSGKLRHRFVDNDCIISPVTFSKGCFMKVQQLPYVQPATKIPASRRHQGATRVVSCVFSFFGFNSIHGFVLLLVVCMMHLGRELSMSCPAEANQVVQGLYTLVLCALSMNATRSILLFQC